MTAIIVLSISTLLLLVLLGLVIIRNIMSTQAITALHQEIDALQEKRIDELKEGIAANGKAMDKLTEAATLYRDTGTDVVRKIEEAIEVFQGNQYAMMQKLNEIARK